MMMLDHEEGGVKSLGKSDNTTSECSLTQKHIFLELQRIKTFQTLHQGV